MTIHARYFAAVAEAAGCSEATLELPAGATVGDLRAALAASYGEDFSRQLAISALLINGVYANDADALPQGEVRADVLPPFAGG